MQLLALLAVAFTAAAGAFPAAERSAADPFAAYLSSHIAPADAAPELRFDPEGEQRADGDDGSAGDWIPGGPSTDGAVSRRRGTALISSPAAPLSEHEATFHQARAPPSA